MGKSSRTKGKVGEREAAKALAKNLGPQADPRRGVQYQGGPDSPDVVGALPGWHIEVKRYKGIAAMRFMDQAVDDAGDLLPAVLMREDRGEWMLMVPLAELWALCEAVAATHGRAVFSSTLTRQNRPGDPGEKGLTQ